MLPYAMQLRELCMYVHMYVHSAHTIESAGPLLETSKFDGLKNRVPDCSAQEKLLDSKLVLKVYFKPSKKKKIFIFTSSYFAWLPGILHFLRSFK